MAKTPTTEQGHEFHLRPGVDPMGAGNWHGVNTEVDPGSLLPGELQRGENIRLLGKDIRTRPGQNLTIDFGLAPGPQDNHVLWMGEAPTDNPRVRLWLSAFGCFGASILGGSTVRHIDPAQIPVVQQYANFYAGGNFQAPLGTYSGELYVGDRDMLRKILLITPHPGVSSSVILASPAQSPVARFPGFTITCLKEFDSKLFVGLSNNTTPASSKIAAFNGLSAKDDLTAVRPPRNFGIWQNKLVATFDSTAANIQTRGIGSSPGTWTAVGLAGFQGATQGDSLQEYGAKLWIASGLDKIYSFDGTVLTLERTIAGCATDGNGCVALSLHRGMLFYGWNGPGAAYAAKLGKMDLDSTASQWIDTYKDLTADQANFKQVSSLISYRKQIYAGGQQLWVVATALDDVQGALQVINNTGAPGAGFEILQMIRHPPPAS